MMNRMNLFIAAALTVGAFACDRNSDNKASETNTTSATPTPTPFQAITTTPAFRANDAASAAALTTGVSTGTQTNSGKGTPNSGNAALPENGGVAPGHIMFPPDKAPGTGAPSSAGSHDLGSGAGGGNKR